MPLSLPQLLEEARRVNPDLQAARKRWEAAQARIPLSKGLPPPRIGVEFEEIPRGTVRLNQATIMYQLIQSLPFPGKRSLREQVAIKEAQGAAMLFKQAEWEITTQLKSAYYDLFLVQREEEIQQAQQVWIIQAAEAAQARYAAGTGTLAELLRVQGEQLSASNELKVLAHRRSALEAHLGHLLNRATFEPMGKTEPVRLTGITAFPDELWAYAQEVQPELLVFRFSAERAEAEWRLRKRELLPDLETMVELRDPAMGPIGPWDLTLALILPFWFWTKQQYGVKAALVDRESMEAAYQGMKNEIARRIHEHWHQAQASYQTARLCEEGLLPLARQGISSALAGYQAGTGSFLELMETLNHWKEQERVYTRHLVEFEQHRVMLEQATGVPL